MSKYGFTGQEDAATDPQTAGAYCAGRKASVAGSEVSTCPHDENTPEYHAWRSGWYSYASGGAITEKDSCADAAKFNSPNLTIALVEEDLTGATYSATTASGGLPNRIDWGDGTSDIRLPGASGAINHTYAENGTYSITSHYLGAVRDTETQVVAFNEPGVTAAVDDTDLTGATWLFTPDAPGLPFTIDFGDESTEDNTAGSETAISHEYAESGDYVITLLYQDVIWPVETITVTITP